MLENTHIITTTMTPAANVFRPYTTQFVFDTHFLSLARGSFDIVAFYASLLILALWHIFLQFLTICLGTFYEKEIQVMGLPFLMMFFGVNLGMNELIGPYGS